MKQLPPIPPATTPTPRSPFRDFRGRGRGFTLIEMLVAIAVLSLMMTLASRMFFDAQRIVSGGAQTSQIINQARTISDQLLKDHRQMHVFESGLGANSPGFLVIVQETLPNVKFPNLHKGGVAPENWLADYDGDGTEEAGTNFDDHMRSDQVAFFRDAKGLESITPGQNDRFDSLAKARHARIWYGHTWPSDVAPTTATDTSPGDTDYDISSQLALGRQALLLVEHDTSSTYPGGALGNSNASFVGNSANNRVVSPGNAFLDFAVAVGFKSTRDVLDLNNFVREDTSSIPQTYQTYRVYDDGGNPATLPTKRALFGSPGWPGFGATFANPSYLDSLLTRAAPAATPAWGTTDRLTNDAYAAAALEWTFVRDGTRLRAAQQLPDNYSAGMFTAKDIGQLHGSFIPHVADFAIEFAADFTDDFSLDANGQIIHQSEPGYPGDDGQPDGRPDTDANGNIKWYTALFPNPDDNQNGLGDVRPADPITWPVPGLPAGFLPARIASEGGGIIDAPPPVDEFDGTATSGTHPGNPFFFVLNPGAGPLSTFGSNFKGTANPRIAFVFSHSGDDLETDGTNSTADVTEGSGKYWPYMIRYRFRLMDGKGKYRSSHPVTDQPVAGRWFEQIVPVPRPVGIY